MSKADRSNAFLSPGLGSFTANFDTFYYLTLELRLSIGASVELFLFSERRPLCRCLKARSSSPAYNRLHNHLLVDYISHRCGIGSAGILT